MLSTAKTMVRQPNVPEAVSMKQRQAPLFQLYASDHRQAIVIDRAETSSQRISADKPLHTHLTIGSNHPAELTIGVHTAVGGNCDFPNPGEVLAAAITSCLDSTIRIIANRMGIALTHLKVKVAARVDVRGTLLMDREVPVGFQDVDIDVDIRADKSVSPLQLNMLLKAAEQSCVVIQTLRNPASINISQTKQQ